jgi:hypothetical protein
MYAEDTGITVQSGRMKLATRKLIDASEVSEPWFNKWRIEININQSSTLFAKRRSHSHHDPFPLKIFRTNLNSAHQINYLAVILDSNL